MASRAISAQRKVSGEYDKLCDALLEGPQNWMPGMYESATGKITQLEAGTSIGRLARYSRMNVGAARLDRHGVVVPITWRSLEAEPLFPKFTGNIRLKQLPDGINLLQIDGSYEPPGGPLGRAADAAVMAAIAKETIKDLVERVASVLARNALGRSVAEQVTAGHLTLDLDPPG
jgi:hypothetical protein